MVGRRWRSPCTCRYLRRKYRVSRRYSSCVCLLGIPLTLILKTESIILLINTFWGDRVDLWPTSKILQVTSPIRRYTDMLAHYQLEAALLGRTPPHSCATLQAACDQGQRVKQEFRKLGSACRHYYLGYYFAAEPMSRSTYSAEVIGITAKVWPKTPYTSDFVFKRQCLGYFDRKYIFLCCIKK